MVESKQSYEECRRKRIEENKKRMEELNIGKLALAFKASRYLLFGFLILVRTGEAIESNSRYLFITGLKIESDRQQDPIRTAKYLSHNKPPSKPPVIRFESADPYPTSAFVKADLSSFKQVVQMLTGSSK